MPILDIQIVGEISNATKKNFAQKLADAAGEILHSQSNGTWVKVHFLNSENYAENGGPSKDIAPIFVRVIQRSIPETNDLIQQAAELTKAIAQICNRPAQNVHVIYEPPGSGRVAFGGKLVK